MRKRVRLTAMLIALSMLLCACARSSERDSDESRVVLPESAAETLRLGDASEGDKIDVTLYYPSGDGRTLSAVTRSLAVSGNESAAERILSELFYGNAAGFTVGPEDRNAIRLLNAEFCCGTATVDLSLEALSNRTPQELHLFCAAVANTLIEAGEADAVNFLCGGQAFDIASLPMGAFAARLENPAADYAQRQTDSDRLAADPAATAARNVILYYPSADGRCLLPEAREISTEEDAAVLSVIEALAQPARTRTCCVSAIPSNLDLLTAAPAFTVTESGQQIVDLQFSPMVSNYLAFAGVEPWQLYGSIVLSICSFVPEIEGVRIVSDGETIRACAIADRIAVFPDGIIRRADFDACIGSSATLCFAGNNGGLIRRECAMPRAETASATGLLRAMIENDAGGLFPVGIRTTDVLGASVQAGVATVNLSGGFYAKCQSLNAAQERRLVYAMVNTLCALPHVGAVRFAVEGRQTDSLAGEIYLKSALLPDPGLYED